MKIKKINILKSAVLLVVATIFLGCSSAPSPVRVQIDSYGAVNPQEEKIYFLELGYNEGVGGELAVRNYAMEIDLMLYDSGYRKVFDRNLANQIITFEFGTEGPFVQERVSTRPVRVGVGLGFGYGSGRWGGRGGYYNGFIGDDMFLTDVIEREEYFRKYLLIKSRNPKGGAIFEILAVNNNSTSDIRALFPYLVKGASQYIGRDSGAVVTVNIPVVE